MNIHFHTKIICRRSFLSQTTQILMISSWYFAEDGYEIYNALKRTCWAVILLITFFVLPRPRCRRRRGFLTACSHADVTAASKGNATTHSAEFSLCLTWQKLTGVLYCFVADRRNNELLTDNAEEIALAVWL